LKKKGIIIFDMDDTLVKREEVYIEAQKTLLQTLKEFGADIPNLNDSLAILRKIDFKLVSLHKGEFMYDYEELARALWLHIVEKKNLNDACKIAFKEGKKGIHFEQTKEAAERHDKILKEKIPELEENAIETLKKLRENFVLILLSIGKQNVQENVIKFYNFDKIFDAIVICPRKNLKVFKEVKKKGLAILNNKYPGSSDRVIVVGDMLSQDITYGKRINAETIWIPGPYDPKTCKIRPDHKISNLLELLDLLSP
jgi:FMN phosphatase YigB (HAD superfamily)